MVSLTSKKLYTLNVKSVVNTGVRKLKLCNQYALCFKDKKLRTEGKP